MVLEAFLYSSVAEALMVILVVHAPTSVTLPVDVCMFATFVFLLRKLNVPPPFVLACKKKGEAPISLDKLAAWIVWVFFSVAGGEITGSDGVTGKQAKTGCRNSRAFWPSGSLAKLWAAEAGDKTKDNTKNDSKIHVIFFVLICCLSMKQPLLGAPMKLPHNSMR